jgi:hypothetical protein
LDYATSANSDDAFRHADTFRTFRNARLASDVRSKADHRTFDTLTIVAADGTIFRSGFKLICLVQPGLRKYFLFSSDPNHLFIRSVSSRGGAARDRHEGWDGMRWTRQRRRARRLQGGFSIARKSVSISPARGRTALQRLD